jgi:hypothetical protein
MKLARIVVGTVGVSLALAVSGGATALASDSSLTNAGQDAGLGHQGVVVDNTVNTHRYDAQYATAADASMGGWLSVFPDGTQYWHDHSLNG